MLFPYNERLQICRHGHELQFRVMVAAVHQDPFISHPFRQNHLIERRLLVNRTKKHDVLFVIKVFITFCVIFLFNILLFSGLQSVCHFRCCTPWLGDLLLLKMVWEQL